MTLALPHLRWLLVLATMLCGTATGFSFSSQIQNARDQTTSFAPTPASIQGLVARDDFNAARGADDLVDLASPARRSHILDGEVRPDGSFGGGHRPGTGFPNKSEFPAGWSDDQIMHHISDVATDPLSTVRAGRGGDSFVRGTRDGVDIEVLIRNGEIWTGYPTSVPRNPR